MSKKRRKLDQFLTQRKKNQDLVLEEKSQLSDRVFRFVAGALLTFFVAVLAQPPNFPHAVGLGVLFLILTTLGGLCLHRLQPGVFERTANFNKFVLLVLVTVALCRVVVVMKWSAYLVPIPMFAMIVALAYAQGTALLSSLAIGFFAGLISPRAASWVSKGADGPESLLAVPIDFPLTLVVTVGAVTAILGVRRVRKQSKPFVVGIYAGVAQALTILGLEFMNPAFSFSDMGDPERLHEFLKVPGSGLAGGIISGGIVTCLLPLIEQFFGILTERRLLDLADPSSDLLRILRERAPGTYQHTLGVAQLASNAAEAIGADRLLAEVGAYYHDIGKIFKPEYFVENMGEDKTIHDRLRPNMSKMVIISHVKDGIDLAREARLPQQIIDMIPMHHGTTVVEYFYQKARREMGSTDEAPQDIEYRYPGAKPTFREAGILMLADMIEAIAKTETEPNPSRFRAMVHEQILRRLLDGQLDETDLTLNDLRAIEDSFVRTLTNMYHSRIKYPGAEENPPDESTAARAASAPTSKMRRSATV